MPTFRTALVPSYNQRSFATPAGKDQFVKAAIFKKVVNPITQSVTIYTEKRGGLASVATIAAGSAGSITYYSPSTRDTIFVFGQAVWNRRSSTNTNCGSISASHIVQGHPIEEIISGVTHILISTIHSSTGASEGWDLPSDAIANVAYTGDGNNSITITDLKVSGVSSVAGLYVGQKLSAGANIVAGSRIATINAGAFSLTLDTATTGGAFNDLAITKEPLAKIVDPDFPTNVVGPFSELDGYALVMGADGKLWNSDLNAPASWTATNFLTASLYSDNGLGCYRVKNQIVGFSNASIEFFFNNGNAAGSPFSSSPQLAINAGLAAPAFIGVFGAITYANSVSQSIADTIYWVGQDFNLYTLSGYAIKQINTSGPFSQLILGGGGTPQVSAFNYDGMIFLNISSAAFWYCITTDTWHEPAFPSASSYASVVGGWVLGGSDTTGKYYALSTSGTFQDNGSAFTMSIQIATDMQTNRRKFINEFRINADNQTSGNIALSWSDDDGLTYSTPVNIPLNASMKKVSFGLDSFRGRRLWKLEDAGNNANRMSEIEIDYDLSTT